MKKILLVFVLLGALSCSSDDKECKKVTGVSALKVNDVWVYTIEIDNGEPITTNKATVDFYSHSEAPECYEGLK